MKTLPENEVKDLLREHDIQTTKYVVVKNENELVKIGLQYPLALKLCSSKVLHKTDVDGVKLGINNVDELKKEFRELKKRFPEEKFLVEQMEAGGIEAIVGLSNDPTFGVCIMFGLGGVFTEVLEDVVFRVVPIEKDDAEDMLTEINGRKILEGFRGVKINRKKLIDLMLRASELGAQHAHRLKSLDLNPVFLREKDVVVVDAKLVWK